MLFEFIYNVLCYDIWFYLSHLVLHTKPFYFIHKIHHQPNYKTLTYKDTHIAHWFENLIQPLGVFIPITVHGYKNISISTLLVSMCFICVRGMMRHDHRCTWLIGDHHLLHHKNQKYNFGEYWLDFVFNTVYPKIIKI